MDVNLGHVRVINVGGDGLYLSSGHVGSGVRWADNVRFHHSVIDGTGRSGVSITDGASNSVIELSTFRHIAFYTLQHRAQRAGGERRRRRRPQHPILGQRARVAALWHRRQRTARRPRVRRDRLVRRRTRRGDQRRTQQDLRPAVRRRRLQQRRLAPQHQGQREQERHQRRGPGDVLRWRHHPRPSPATFSPSTARASSPRPAAATSRSRATTRPDRAPAQADPRGPPEPHGNCKAGFTRARAGCR